MPDVFYLVSTREDDPDYEETVQFTSETGEVDAHELAKSRRSSNPFAQHEVMTAEEFEDYCNKSDDVEPETDAPWDAPREGENADTSHVEPVTQVPDTSVTESNAANENAEGRA